MLFLMRAIVASLFLGFLTGLAPGEDDARIVQKFDGSDTATTTPTFTVQDKWEVLWFSPRPINVTLLSPDGTVINGVHGVFKGSFYQAKGGTYYLQLNSDHPEMKIPWHLVIAEVASGTNISAADAGGMASNPGDSNYAPPATILPPGQFTPSASYTSTSAPAWTPHGQAVTSTPVAPPTPSPSTTPAPIVKLTEDQARAVVLIKGDNAEGTGFLIKTPAGPMVATNIHVISNNPNLKITTNTGEPLTILSLKGADDRDLAMIGVKDGNYSYLTLATDVSTTVQPGDEVITPGNSEGGEVMLNTDGKVLGIGPDRIEFDNPVYHGNSGGPVFHVKSGKVIGVVTEAVKVDVSDDLDKSSFANRNSAISNSIRYFGLRLDNVPNWEAYDWRRFLVETAFLDQFNLRSVSLDCYLNAPDDNKPEDLLWQKDEKIVKANRDYFDQSAGGDASQRLDATRLLYGEFGDIADIDLDTIQNLKNFYSFDRQRAKDEAEYRKDLKKELDNISNDVSRLGSLPRSNN